MRRRGGGEWALLVIAMGCGGGPGAASPPAVVVGPGSVGPGSVGPGSVAPDFTARDLDGKPFRLGDHLGKEVILLDFWATFCQPCQAQFPHLGELYARDRDRGLLVLGVAMDGPDSSAGVAAFARRHEVSFPVVLDDDARIAGLYDPKRSMPLSVLIGRDGRVVAVREGYDPGDAKLEDADVEKALGEGGASASGSAPASAPGSASASAPLSFVEGVSAPGPARMPSVNVSSPRKNDLVPADKAPDLDVRFSLASFPLGHGNRLELVLDDRAALFVDDPARPVHLRDIDPSPAASAPGQHLLVAIPVGPTGEAVKPAGKGKAPIAVVPFFVGQRTPVLWKEGAPLLIYAGPPPGGAPAEGLLVDFYLVNADLGTMKYSVHASVTGPDLMTGKVIEAWKPWRIKGARQGSYTIRLELDRSMHELGESGSSTTVVLASKPIDGKWTTVTRDFDLPP